jgi:hypothetical protein
MSACRRRLKRSARIASGVQPLSGQDRQHGADAANQAGFIVTRGTRTTLRRFPRERSITFRTTGGAINTHRIVEVVEDEGVRYRTKGD